MILALLEDGVLNIYNSVEDITGDIEALDIEETLKEACDERATLHT